MYFRPKYFKSKCNKGFFFYLSLQNVVFYTSKPLRAMIYMPDCQTSAVVNMPDHIVLEDGEKVR